MKEKGIAFEEAIKELEQIIDKLEKGELSLDESIMNFQKGIELSRYCSRKLDDAEKSIMLLIEDEKGNISEEPFNAEKPEPPHGL